MAFSIARLYWPVTLLLVSFFILSKSYPDVGSYFKSHSFDVDVSPVEDISAPIHQADLFLRQTTTASNASTGSGTYTCGPDSPCTNGACCGESGWCGYGTYCGDGCQSNCDATAACGQYAATAGQTCPLNVCCSEFGFCGTTSDFCGTGCQSDCSQPLPASVPGNVQSRVLGYWESWNSQNPCGTMTPGEIPAALLTHLYVAFAYITADYDVTNMDGVASEIYQNVGNVKSKNPDLKILISIGGWAFDQSIFSNMVSSSGTRATCIQNVLNWLGEYGYDGVDFDWEYPGASDRSGVPADTENYVSFLQELRAAITAAGKDYIVTFTAPTSYWYLQNFDLPGMVESVDWINLMTYDLHGVWDAEDVYIGSEVLAHTNLTEIDLALDLFWRVGIDPSDIVMGLGFYGRSYQLSDPSCWQPGCPFVAAGAAGPCTQTPGILSYREVMQIIADTGAAPYTDETAAVQYMVYGDNNWVSYDNALTWAAKIEYANQMGLSGLMVWAIDLDDANHDALSAITDSSLLSDSGVTFSLVPLDYLFPSDLLPSNDSTINYGLINFGSGASTGSMDPSTTGFGFMIVSGDSSSVSNLKKRDGIAEPFVFLDCPSNVHEDDSSLVHTARVVCLSLDLKGCFQVLEGGVEGTIVEMPDNCAENTFARAISLEVSKDQHVTQDVIGKRTTTSQVYDFKFDFNMELAKRDTDTPTTFRIDICNLPTYWSSIVDAPGIQSRDLNNLETRYFAPTASTWQEKMVEYYDTFGVDNSFEQTINEDLTRALFWETTSTAQCNVDGEDFTEGIAAYVSGNVKSNMYYGFSMIGTVESAGLVIEPSQTSGFISVTGTTDLTFGVGGVGNFDIGKANKGNPAVVQGTPTYVGGNTVDVDGGNWVTFKPYYEIDYEVATFNASTGDSDPNADAGATAPFDGLLEARVVTDLGQFTASFPPNMSDTSTTPFPYNGKRSINQISIPTTNVMYDSSGAGGSIGIANYVRFGVEIDVGWRLSKFVTSAQEAELVDFQIVWNTLAQFTFTPDPSEVCVEYDIATQCFQTVISSTDKLDWDDGIVDLVYDRQSPDSSELCYAIELDLGQKKRDLNGSDALTSRASSGGFPGFGYAAGGAIDVSDILSPAEAAIFAIGVGGAVAAAAAIACANGGCVSCTETSENDGDCCGCLCLRCVYGFQDIDSCPECDTINVDGSWPGSNIIALPGKREIAASEKSSSEKSSIDYDDSLPIGDEVSKFEERDSAHLVPRVNGIATISSKEVTGCGGTKLYLGQPYAYPAFPSNQGYAWDGIQNGKWDDIERYYGNSSAVCSDWGVFAKATADTVNTGGTAIRADYQTEHVLEGQLIGDFFKVWLAGDGVTNQPTTVNIYPNPQNQVPCGWTEQYVQSTTIKMWDIGTTLEGSFFGLLLSELGSTAHLDRLTILMARPNLMKGTLTSGFRAISPDVGAAYRSMTAEEQLLAVKDMGMVFSYMNDADVWDQFCETFEAIYSDLQEFDTWFGNTVLTQLPSNLAAEWPNFIRATLDSMVVRARSLFVTLYGIRVGQGNADIWEANWAINNAAYRTRIQLPGTCTNLQGTTV